MQEPALVVDRRRRTTRGQRVDQLGALGVEELEAEPKTVTLRIDLFHRLGDAEERLGRSSVRQRLLAELYELSAT